MNYVEGLQNAGRIGRWNRLLPLPALLDELTEVHRARQMDDPVDDRIVDVFVGEDLWSPLVAAVHTYLREKFAIQECGFAEEYMVVRPAAFIRTNGFLHFPRNYIVAPDLSDLSVGSPRKHIAWRFPCQWCGDTYRMGPGGHSPWRFWYGQRCPHCCLTISLPTENTAS